MTYRPNRDQQAKNVDVDIEIVAWTDNALRVTDGGEPAWVPISQLVDFDEDDDLWQGKTMTLTMPEWLAREKRLI